MEHTTDPAAPFADRLFAVGYASAGCLPDGDEAPPTYSLADAVDAVRDEWRERADSLAFDVDEHGAADEPDWVELAATLAQYGAAEVPDPDPGSLYSWTVRAESAEVSAIVEAIESGETEDVPHTADDWQTHPRCSVSEANRIAIMGGTVGDSSESSLGWWDVLSEVELAADEDCIELSRAVRLIAAAEPETIERALDLVGIELADMLNVESAEDFRDTCREAIETVDRLESYCILDEELHSMIELERQVEAFGEFRDDLAHALAWAIPATGAARESDALDDARGEIAETMAGLDTLERAAAPEAWADDSTFLDCDAAARRSGFEDGYAYASEAGDVLLSLAELDAARVVAPPDTFMARALDGWRRRLAASNNGDHWIRRHVKALESVTEGLERYVLPLDCTDALVLVIERGTARSQGYGPTRYVGAYFAAPAEVPADHPGQVIAFRD